MAILSLMSAENLSVTVSATLEYSESLSLAIESIHALLTPMV